VTPRRTLPPAVQNERTKLFANALDRASTACVAVGILAPVATLLAGGGSSASAALAAVRIVLG